MPTREEAKNAANILFTRHCNEKVHNAYKVYNSDIYGLLKTVILKCVENSSVEGGKIKVESPIEFSICLSALRKIEKDGFIN